MQIRLLIVVVFFFLTQKLCSFKIILFSVDGMWADWGSWGTCSTTCGGGNQNRTRNCTNPEPQYGGADCVGNAQDSPQTCNTNPCPSESQY